MPPTELLGLTATCALPYSHPDRERTRSEPIAESSQGPSFGRRTQSETALNTPALPLPLARSSPAADNAVRTPHRRVQPV